MVKQEVFCREVNFAIRYYDGTHWDIKVRLATPTQDAMDMRKHILQKIAEFENGRKGERIFSNKTQHMVVSIANFVTHKLMQYSLFDNSMRRDDLRKTMYEIKDNYGKNSVRRAAETLQHDVMRDAIGFGSVKDLYEGKHFNHYLLEEDILGAKKQRTIRVQEGADDDTPDWDINQDTDALAEYAALQQQKEMLAKSREVRKPVYKPVSYFDGWA
jgi:hypothetical protein